jgi:hypothetical protein
VGTGPGSLKLFLHLNDHFGFIEFFREVLIFLLQFGNGFRKRIFFISFLPRFLGAKLSRMLFSFAFDKL